MSADPGQPWIDSPDFEMLLAESGLGSLHKEQLRSFSEQGFIVFDPGIDDIDTLAERVVRDCSADPEYPDRVMDGWTHSNAIRELASAQGVLDLLANLYRRDPIPMQTLNFGRGTEQLAHADAFHFSSVPRGFVCGVWIALEDIDSDNGALEYYPGSHRLPYFDLSDLGLSGREQRGVEWYPRYEALIQRQIERLGLKPERLHIPKGRAIAWSANLLHGGSPVRDRERTRHSQVTHYYFSNCLYYQPQRSDPFLGRIHWLDKRDVRTGRPIPQVHLGRRRRWLPRSPWQWLVWLARRCMWALDRQARRPR